MGSTIVVLAFDEVDKAAQVLKSVHEMESHHLVQLKDSAVVTKNDKGKVKIKESEDVSVGRGAVTGSVLGFIIGLVAGGPVVGLALGGALGAFAGKKIDLGIDNDKIKAITEQMTNNSSVLFLQFISVEKVEWLSAFVRDSGGEVVELQLSDDTEVDVNEFLADYTARH